MRYVSLEAEVLELSLCWRLHRLDEPAQRLCLTSQRTPIYQDLLACMFSALCESYPSLYQASIIDRLESPVQSSTLRRSVSYRISGNIQHNYRQSEDVSLDILVLVSSIYSHDPRWPSLVSVFILPDLVTQPTYFGVFSTTLHEDDAKPFVLCTRYPLHPLSHSLATTIAGGALSLPQYVRSSAVVNWRDSHARFVTSSSHIKIMSRVKQTAKRPRLHVSAGTEISNCGRDDRFGVRARYADPPECLSDFFSTRLCAAPTRGCIAFRLDDMLRMERRYSDTLSQTSQREQRRVVLDLEITHSCPYSEICLRSGSLWMLHRWRYKSHVLLGCRLLREFFGLKYSICLLICILILRTLNHKSDTDIYRARLDLEARSGQNPQRSPCPLVMRSLYILRASTEAAEDCQMIRPSHSNLELDLLLGFELSASLVKRGCRS
ncbi:hypothetical protein KCU95_g71, partial [Aureobasidium melanogenum]